MAAQRSGSLLDRIMDTDSSTPPRQNVLALLTLGFGLVALACAFVPEWHVAGGWTGLVGLGLGAMAQMESSTTAQRWVIVPGWVLSFIGLLMGFANGGLW
jgi:hypothetical protein